MYTGYGRFHQIVFWPVELAGEGDYDLDRIASKLVADGETWKVVDSLDRGATTDASARYAEYVYFHPFVQRFLYAGPNDPEHKKSFRILARGRVAQARVTLSVGSAAVVVTVAVERVHLYIFQPRMAMVVVEISTQGLPRELLLALQDQFRRTYAPYFYEVNDQVFGGGCPRHVEWLDAKGDPTGDASSYDDLQTAIELTASTESRRPAFSKHWLWLIQPLAPAGAAQGDQIPFASLEDDRMPSMCFIEHAAPHSISRTDLIRLCFYDGPGQANASPYAPGFLADFEQRHTYRRFWDPAIKGFDTLYLCCGYGFVLLAAQDGPMSGVLQTHFRRHYFQLGLIAHFHRAALLRFSRRFTEVTLAAPDMNDAVYAKLREVREEFASFLNNQWFHEVSNQDQGRELFDFWNSHLGSVRLMDDLATEAAAVDRMLSSHRAEADREEEIERNRRLDALALESKNLSERVDRLTVLIYWLAGLTLGVAALDAQFMKDLLKPYGWQAPFRSLAGLAVLLALLQALWLAKKRRE